VVPCNWWQQTWQKSAVTLTSDNFLLVGYLRKNIYFSFVGEKKEKNIFIF